MVVHRVEILVKHIEKVCVLRCRFVAVDAFPSFQAIGIEPEVLFSISKGCFYVPPLAIVCGDLRYLKRQIRCEDAEILIRF